MFDLQIILFITTNECLTADTKIPQIQCRLKNTTVQHINIIIIALY